MRVCRCRRCVGTATVAVPNVASKVLVLQREKPVITVSGDSHVSCLELDLTRGEEIFHSISVISQTRQEVQEADNSKVGSRELSYAYSEPDSCCVITVLQTGEFSLNSLVYLC